MADSGRAADPPRAAGHAERRDDARGDSAGRSGARRKARGAVRLRCSDSLRWWSAEPSPIFCGPSRNADALTLGRRTQVTLDPGLEIDPALSPDGNLIAYASGALGRTRSWYASWRRRRQHHSDHRRHAGRPGGPRWSPDGTRIAFESPRGIEVVPALGGQSRVIAEAAARDSASDVTWSPDGQRIAYRIGTPSTVAPRTEADRRPGRRRLRAALAGLVTRRPLDRVRLRQPVFIDGPRSTSATSRPAPSSLSGRRRQPVAVTDDYSLNVSPVWLPRGAAADVRLQSRGRARYLPGVPWMSGKPVCRRPGSPPG